MKKSLAFLTLLSTSMAFTSVSLAADPRQACREDARTLCKDIQPGGGRIKDCLEDHYKEISQDCYDALQKAESRKGGNREDGPPPPQGPGTGPEN